MTGWRIGWAVAPQPVAKFMGDIQSQETSNPCSVSQWAALEAIVGPQDSVVDDESRVSEAARLRPLANCRSASERHLHSSGWGVLCVHERLGALRPNYWWQTVIEIPPRSAWLHSAKRMWRW